MHSFFIPVILWSRYYYVQAIQLVNNEARIHTHRRLTASSIKYYLLHTDQYIYKSIYVLRVTGDPVIPCILCNLSMILLVVSYLGNVFELYIGAVFPKGPSV